MTHTDLFAETPVDPSPPVAPISRLWKRWLETPRSDAHSHDWLGWDAWVSPGRPDGR